MDVKIKDELLHDHNIDGRGRRGSSRTNSDGNPFQREGGKTMLSRWLARVAGIASLCLVVCTAASAQYSGGTGGTAGTPGTPGYSYGSGKAIGIGVGVAAAAAVGIVLLVHHHHHAAARSQASVIGCTQSMFNGISLTNESDDQNYMIISARHSLATRGSRRT